MQPNMEKPCKAEATCCKVWLSSILIWMSMMLVELCTSETMRTLLLLKAMSLNSFKEVLNLRGSMLGAIFIYFQRGVFNLFQTSFLCSEHLGLGSHRLTPPWWSLMRSTLHFVTMGRETVNLFFICFFMFFSFGVRW